MIFYYVFSALFLLFQAFIVLTTKINIFPELVFYPWLVSKGLLIYRDFNAQHGYFLQALLAPFVGDTSLLTLKGFYVVLQLVDLLLVMRILKKTTNKLGFIVGSILFIVLNYYLSDSNLWDEIIVTSVYLSLYLLLMNTAVQNNKKLLLSGVLIGAVSFMKPSFAVLLIPVGLFYRSCIPVISVSFIWIFSCIFFALNKSFNSFLDGYIFFNKFYVLGAKNIFAFQTAFTEKSFMVYTVVLLAASIALFFTQRKKFKDNPILLFVLFSLILFFPGYSKINLPPFGTFLCIFVGQLLGKIKKPYFFLYFFVVVVYLIFIAHKTERLYAYFKTNRLPYLENSKTARIVKKVKSFHVSKNKVYVLGNNVELYYYLDTLPPVWYSIVWQVTLQYDGSIQERIIRELKAQNVMTILIPQPLDTNYVHLDKLKQYLRESYTSIYKDADFQMLKKK